MPTWEERYRNAAETGQLIFPNSPTPVLVAALDNIPFPNTPNPTAIDVGAGEGRHSRELARRGFHVTALDSSPTGLATAQSIGDHPNIKWECADLKDWRPKHPADLVIVSNFHPPAPKLLRLLVHVSTWLTNDGHLVAIGHARQQFGRDTPGPKDPQRLWDPNELRIGLAQAGLIVERAENIDNLDLDRAQHFHTSDAVIDTIVVARPGWPRKLTPKHS